MARINVNPTRMELKKLKARLKTAIRGHKLLKDKTDEMVRRFSVVVRENKRMRDEVENDVVAVLKQFAVARSFLSTEEIELAFAIPSVTVDLDYGTKNIMSVSVPELRLKESRSMLADEIEKSKRRVNALEYVMIPDLQETISYITMKLEENERGSLTRLMKVKAMIEQRAD